MFLNAILLALREIRRNLMRSFLTVLGIVIGVAAVITMVTLGNGATRMVAEQISSLGSNLLILRPGQRLGPGRDSAGAPNFRAADVEALLTQVPSLKAVAPVVSSTVTLVAGAENWSSSVTGSTNAYFVAGNWKLAAGRQFSDEEMRAGKAVCVIGNTVKQKLFAGQSPLGNAVRVKNFSCEIVGILASKGQGAMGMDQDDVVLMPLVTAQRRLTGKTQDVSTLMLSLKDGASSPRVMEQIRQLMRERRKLAENDDDNFNLMDTKQIAEALSGTIGTMTTLLGAVAAVSLLVGGIGIMNIMLVSVTERTREIGIRLAIGALENEVLLQFLIEAVALSAFGGLVGIILALLACLGLSALMGMPFLFNPGINLLAFGFSAAIGVIFGYVPARRAAGLDPIEALRHE
ncbi:MULTISPECIES: ABC transporter permease [Azospira]|jgi:putative ABC transport system permease protein|uniref:ABC-type antimicrobial peptide transport system, permease component n=2 Tax=Azospira oryzae TaxID=146939 RepID=G8QIQ0_AZOOP|nr:MULTISPECIES: ABC transporter permease [Azospira]AEV27510.1 ABC-type antimicrobial peptide transport system, permease component [Azospira oryzae PS]MDK9689411.1 ABC transporter permease [Azospira sp.]RZT90377.1 putative ABC transport system permease protein [Azospira oryzae]TLS17562.1 MAG: FtsX-like permease family protein [Betaproteobacteria bacterium]